MNPALAKNSSRPSALIAGSFSTSVLVSISKIVFRAVPKGSLLKVRLVTKTSERPSLSFRGAAKNSSRPLDERAG
jgi:hypothetical protein